MLVLGELNSAQIEGYDFGSLPAPTMLRRIVFDKTNNRFLIADGVQWRAVGSIGGSSISQWVEGAPAPEALIEDSMLKYVFQQMEGQSVTSMLKVPSLYAGSQILLKFDLQSSDNTGNVMIDVITTLIRQGVDVFSTSTNQNSYTQTITLSAGTVDIPQEIVAELTDANGDINGVAVSPGDYLKIMVRRNTGDMSAVECKIPVHSTEIIFD